jgi:signal peptidase I
MTVWQKFWAWKKKKPKNFIEEWVDAIITVVPAVFLIKTFLFGLYQVPTCSMEHTLLVGERFFADKLTPYFEKYMPYQRGEIIAMNSPIYKYSDNIFVNTYERYIDWNIENWTKRIVGLPGEHIVGKIEDGKPVIYINDQKLDEPYVNEYPVVAIIKGNQPVHRTYVPDVPLDQQPYYRFNQVEFTRSKQWHQMHDQEFLGQPQTPTDGRDGKSLDEFDVHLGPDEYWCMGDNRKASYDSRGWGPLKKHMIHARILFRIFSMDTDNSWIIFDFIFHPIRSLKQIRWSRCLQWVK